MQAIKDTVKIVMQGLETKKGAFLKENPEHLLRKVFSKKELAHVRFNYFKKGILSLNVDSSTWLYHLSLQRQTLLAKFGKESSVNIKDVRFYLGEIK